MRLRGWAQAALTRNGNNAIEINVSPSSQRRRRNSSKIIVPRVARMAKQLMPAFTSSRQKNKTHLMSGGRRLGSHCRRRASRAQWKCRGSIFGKLEGVISVMACGSRSSGAQ